MFGTSTTFDRDNILLQHMQPETRRALMSELPGAYNRLCGRDVVTVIRNCDGQPVP